MAVRRSLVVDTVQTKSILSIGGGQQGGTIGATAWWARVYAVHVALDALTLTLGF